MRCFKGACECCLHVLSGAAEGSLQGIRANQSHQPKNHWSYLSSGISKSNVLPHFVCFPSYSYVSAQLICYFSI